MIIRVRENHKKIEGNQTNQRISKTLPAPSELYGQRLKLARVHAELGYR